MFQASLPSSMLDRIPCDFVRTAPCETILWMKKMLESLLKEESLKAKREVFSSFEGVFVVHFSPCLEKS